MSLDECSESAFFHIITNYSSVPDTPSTMRKTGNLLQVPHTIKIAILVIESHGINGKG